MIDELTITFEAGRGGNGKSSFFPGKKGGPNGGNGGNGGSVILKINPQFNSLSHLGNKRLFKAESGEAGGTFRKTGRNGADLVIFVPNNTTVCDLATKYSVTLDTNRPQFVICYGGNGGKGNESFKSPTNRAPKYCETGSPGQKKMCKIIVKMIADAGFIGLPNAGKSSLLNALTNASVKTANYPFTTLEPALGMCEDCVLADIPGLIEGASKGKGLGTKFLKHIEKVKILIHCISLESSSLQTDYETVKKELGIHNPSLLDKKEIILFTKADVSSQKEIERKMKEFKKNKDVLVETVSIYDTGSLEKIKKLLQDETKCGK